jgi:RimJ/RimL family protein N-acetyltransferase
MAMTPPDILTPRLRLRAMGADFLGASADGHDIDELSALIGLKVAPAWLRESDLAALRLQDITTDPASLPWSVRALARRDSGEMIGHAGFHSRPAPDYLAPYAADAVEIGYTIYPRHRRQGLARETLVALIRWAHVEHGVPRFVASVSPDNLASCALLATAGFRRIASFIDEIDGLEYVLLLDAPDVARLLGT